MNLISYPQNPDYKDIIRLKREAQEGNKVSQYQLGCCYYHGCGVEKNAKKAVEWLAEAAHQKLFDAYYKLGDIYAYGNFIDHDLDIRKDIDDALYWYKRAADYNNPDALFRYEWVLEKKCLDILLPIMMKLRLSLDFT